MANTKLPSQISKMRRIEGFGENVSQLALYVNELHLYISFLNMVSQEPVSHFNVFGSPMENWVMGKAYGTVAITHEGYTLVGHSIISHGLHYPMYLGATANSKLHTWPLWWTVQQKTAYKLTNIQEKIRENEKYQKCSFGQSHTP
jgi:hypothetical protein